ncbi:ATR1 [Candida jiufengensis]|uniref:ATR1 n=1 Tax=Candida jiufengensis TaxID=497108 RepID=UPI002224A0D3|nr:ATR1 [Candida jiufengensis]KAI5953627.1 ATR1 [Candida jiufengensis]
MGLLNFDERPKIFKSSFHELIVVTLVCLAQFLTQAGITMCLSTMNIILKDFKNSDSSSLATWFMGGYALTVGSFILVSGRIADLFGLKKVFVIGWIWIIIWSIIAGCSYYTNSIIFFIICRAFQGIGFALILPTGLGILGHIYSNGGRKNFVFGCVGANGPTGACLGALMAGVVAQTWWWPWIFWLLAIFCSILLVLSVFYIPHFVSDQQEGSTLEKIDIPGCILGLVGLILLNFVWTQGPVVGWGKAYIIVLLVISVFTIIGFFIYEIKFANYPLLPKSIFNIKIGLVLACMSFGWGSFGAWQFYYWNIILNLRKYSPIEGGLTYIPFLVLGIIASLLVSFVISHTKPSFIISFSSLCFMIGCIMLSVTPIEQSFYRMTMGQMFILSGAMDMSFPSATIILMDVLEEKGMAGSLVSTIVNYSVSLFLGMSTCVEIETFKHNQNLLLSYRAALYFATGIAGLGFICSLIFIFVQRDDIKGTTAFIEVDNIDESSIEKK